MTPRITAEIGSEAAALPAQKRQAAAATAFPLATRAALEMLHAGGNAVDAAVAAAWALSVCEPSGSGLGGQTTMLLYTAEGTARVIDGHSHAPAAASCETISETQQRTGHRACTIPSTVATLGYAQEKYGVLARAQVMSPAIEIAEDGYRITPLQQKQMKGVSRHLEATPGIAKLFLPEGAAPRAGDVLRQPELAATLYRLAEQGTEEFYQGTIAELIARDMKANGGLITQEELAGLKLPVERKAVSIAYRGHRVLSTPPPGGGLQLLLALQVLEHLDGGTQAVDWYERVAATVHAVFQEREASPCLPDTFACPQDWLRRGDRARKIADDIRRLGVVSLHGKGDGPGDTTHLSVTDGYGNSVALTQSIQSIFGAKVAHPTLGFVYNNYLCTSPRDPGPYQLGPGCMPRSNAAPTMVLRNTERGCLPRLALGAAGSRRITSSILQVVSNVVDRGMELDEAVAAPRIHALLSGKVWVEEPAASRELLPRLQRRFSEVQVKPAHNLALGCVQGLQWLPDGRVLAAADPRRDGAAAVLQ